MTFFEVANGITNTGVMGLGEVAHVASTAAVACAVYDALACRRSLPMTPNRVLAARGTCERVGIAMNRFEVITPADVPSAFNCWLKMDSRVRGRRRYRGSVEAEHRIAATLVNLKG